MDLLELMMELDIYFFGSEKHDAIYNRIIYLRSLKTNITYVFSHYYAKIKVDSYDSLAIEGRFILHNTIILIKSLLHNFIQLSLNSNSAQVQTLLAACRRFAMVRISDNGPGWK